MSNNNPEAARPSAINTGDREAGQLELVRLRTSGGEFVSMCRAPRFKPRAEVILWGSRFFVSKDGSPDYFEAMCYAVPHAVAIAEQKLEEQQECSELSNS